MDTAVLPPTRTASSSAIAPLEQLLHDLYRQQAARHPDNHYLRNHAAPRSIANHVRTFQWYRQFLPATGNVLDWGCQHAPDSCLLRAGYHDQFDLYGCDFPGVARHEVFHDFAATKFTPISGNDRLPYDSQFFDAVIGSGVLEHTARDGDSLGELYRVLRPGGVLIITYLPNWLSVNEWWRRVMRRRDFHHRLYGLGETRQMLKHHGFVPLAIRYHTFFWQRWCAPLAGLMKRIDPFQVFSSTLCLVGRKVRCM
jgi:SAM-dependent methyltransferase